MNKFFLVFFLLIVAHNTTIKAQDNDGTLKIPKSTTPSKPKTTAPKPASTSKPTNNWRKKYEYVEDFSEGLAAVELNGKYGFVDKSGNVVIPLKYDLAWWFSEGLASVRLNGKWGFVNKTGVEVVPLIYDWAKQFSEGLAIVALNNKYGFVNNNGYVAIPLIYDGPVEYTFDGDGEIQIRKNRLIITINKKGECVKNCP